MNGHVHNPLKVYIIPNHGGLTREYLHFWQPKSLLILVNLGHTEEENLSKVSEVLNTLIRLTVYPTFFKSICP